ncbi:hypothetical protein ACQ4PT_029614 [Festuca glaucescens]
MERGEEQAKQNGHGDGDAAEWKKVAELRAVVEAQDPAVKRAAKPHGTITDEDVRDEIAKDRVHMHGFDRLGRPMAYLYGARHFPARRDLDDFKRYVAYLLDKICTRLPVGQEKFAAVIYLKGWGYANCDIRGYVAALEIMQNYYPERLGRVLMINVPYMFMAAWKIVYPFIDEKTKKKFVFVANKDLDATLRDAIDENPSSSRSMVASSSHRLQHFTIAQVRPIVD